MRSSLGFHTMTITLATNGNTAKELIMDFKRYETKTNLIKMYHLNEEKNLYRLISQKIVTF